MIIITGLIIYEHYNPKDIENFGINDDMDAMFRAFTNIHNKDNVPQVGTLYDEINAQKQNELSKLSNMLQEAEMNEQKIMKIKQAMSEQARLAATYPVDKPVKSIKSVNTNEILNLSSIDSPINDKYYKIHVNDNCLASYMTHFTLEDCNKDFDDGQHFRITTTTPNSILQKPSTKLLGKITGHCMTSYKDGIVVMPCREEDKSQNWLISPDAYEYVE